MSESGISNFLSTISKAGYARQNHFELIIPKPATINAVQMPEFLTLFTQKVKYPAQSIATSQLMIYGVPVERPYMRTYDPISASFLVDHKMMVKTFFDLWLNSISIDDLGSFRNADTDEKTDSRDINFMKEYVVDITINQISYEAKNPIIYTIKLLDAFPKNVSGLQMSQDATGALMLDVEFMYSKILYTPVLNPSSNTPSVTDNMVNTFGQQTADSLAKSVSNDVFGMAGVDPTQSIASSIGLSNVGKPIIPFV